MSEPLKIEKDSIAGSKFNNVDMSGSTFECVNLSGCTFKNVSLAKCDFHDLTFGHAIITGSCFDGCEIPHGNIDGLKIAGISVADLLEAYKKVHGELPEVPHQDRAAWPHS